MDTLRLFKRPSIYHRGGRDIIMRYQTASSSLHVEMRVAGVEPDGLGSFRDTSWRLVLAGNARIVRIEAVHIPDAVVLPFIMADVLALLRALPADAAKDPEWPLIKAALVTLCNAYDLLVDDIMSWSARRVITKRHLAYRAEHYPRDLTEVAIGIPTA